MESTVSILDLESVAPDQHKEAFACQTAEHIQAKQFGAVVERIVADSELRPADGESDSDFMERLHTDGALKCYSPLKDAPFTLFYLHEKPLIGFLPPDIGGKQVADNAAAISICINVVQAEMMPQWGDSDGVKRLLAAFMLSKLLGSKV